MTKEISLREHLKAIATKGGQARMQALTPKQRHKLAVKAAKASVEARKSSPVKS